MDDCRIVLHDPTIGVPSELGRKDPDEVVRLEHDLSQRVDCRGLGVTLLSSAWALDPVDQGAGAPVLADEPVSGLVGSCLASGGVDGMTYTVLHTATTSDGQTVKTPFLLPVSGPRW